MSALHSVTDASFAEDVLGADGIVIVDFWAEWCPPCRALNPVLEQIAAEHPELKILKLDVDENPDVALAYQALSLPTMKVFRDGELIQTLVGAKPKVALEVGLAPYFSATPAALG